MRWCQSTYPRLDLLLHWSASTWLRERPRPPARLPAYITCVRRHALHSIRCHCFARMRFLCAHTNFHRRFSPQNKNRHPLLITSERFLPLAFDSECVPWHIGQGAECGVSREFVRVIIETKWSVFVWEKNYSNHTKNYCDSSGPTMKLQNTI